MKNREKLWKQYTEPDSVLCIPVVLLIAYGWWFDFFGCFCQLQEKLNLSFGAIDSTFFSCTCQLDTPQVIIPWSTLLMKLVLLLLRKMLHSVTCPSVMWVSIHLKHYYFLQRLSLFKWDLLETWVINTLTSCRSYLFLREWPLVWDLTAIQWFLLLMEEDYGMSLFVSVLMFIRYP